MASLQSLRNNKPGRSARKQSQYAVVGGNATPQVVSTRPDAPSNLPISVVYWGYWKPTGTVYTIPGSTIVTESAQVGVTSATGSSPQQSPNSEIAQLAQQALSAGSFLYSLGPQAGTTGSITGNNLTKQAPVSTSVFTSAEITQGVSGIVKAFKATGWADADIIKYFLTPGQLGYKQFPGLTDLIFIQAVTGIINVSSLLNKKNK